MKAITYTSKAASPSKPGAQHDRRRQQDLAYAQRLSEVARIASELQRQVPGLCRTEALKTAERAIPSSI